MPLTSVRAREKVLDVSLKGLDMNKDKICIIFSVLLSISFSCFSFPTATSNHSKRHQVKRKILTEVTLENANNIINDVLNYSTRKKMAPLSVCVLDSGGHLKAFQRQDNAGILRFDIAYAKAYGALGMSMDSRMLAEKAKQNPAFINAAIVASKGRLMPVPGGVLIRNTLGHIIGAVGVSGDSSDNDEKAAISGITGASLFTN